MTLIAAGPEHAAALAAIHAACFSEPERWDAAAMAALLGMPNALGVIDPDGAMAMARVAADELEVLTLSVCPALRRAGRGRALLQDVARRGHAAGARAAFLEVAEANVAGRALYAAAGFVGVGRRLRYYPGGGDALVLRAALPLSG